MIWAPEYECMDRNELRVLQLSRLKKAVERAYERVPYYKKVFDEIGLKPEHIKTLADLRLIPFTTKDVLREYYPYEFFAVPLKDVVRVHASSGTTGRPTVVGYTRHDLDVWTDCVARIISQAGVTNEDIVQISFGYGLFTGGFGLHYGMERVGATVIPISSGNTERQIRFMQDFGSTALVSTPSYALYMAEVARDMGVDMSKIKLRVGLFGGEPWSESIRQEIEARWNMKATDNYGLSEVIGPGIAGECEYQSGQHIAEDHFIAEIIDPETTEPLGPGEEGELVFTSLTKEALPILRYRTRDISVLMEEPCKCGRTSMRMRKVLGRTDDMLIIRGVNVFPSQIEDVLLSIEGVEPQYQLIVSRDGYLDTLEVLVEVPQNVFTDSLRALESLEKTIKHKIDSVLGLNVKVRLVEPRTLERSLGKAKRVIDKRTM
jgi:phenylacetate-CoA ligase